MLVLYAELRLFPFSLSLEELKSVISTIQPGYLCKKLAGGREAEPTCNRSEVEQGSSEETKSECVGLLLPGSFPHKKDTVSSLEAWKLLDSVSMHG